MNPVTVDEVLHKDELWKGVGSGKVAGLTSTGVRTRDEKRGVGLGQRGEESVGKEWDSERGESSEEERTKKAGTASMRGYLVLKD